MDGDVCQRDAGCRIGRPAHLPLQCFKYEWTVLPFAQQQTEDDECLSGSKIREQVAHFFMSMSGSKIREQVAHFLVDIHIKGSSIEKCLFKSM